MATYQDFWTNLGTAAVAVVVVEPPVVALEAESARIDHEVVDKLP